MGDDVDHGPGVLGPDQLLHQPGQLTSRVLGPGQQPQVVIVTEVAVDGQNGQVWSDLKRDNEINYFRHVW